MSYSKALRMKYTYYPNLDQIIFEDGVCYTMREALIVSKMKSANDIRMAHETKKAFGGEIMHEKDGQAQAEQDKSWFELEFPVIESDPSPVISAVLKKELVIDAEILTLDL